MLNNFIYTQYIYIYIYICRLSHAASNAIEKIKDRTRKGITAAVKNKSVASVVKQNFIFIIIGL